MNWEFFERIGLVLMIFGFGSDGLVAVGDSQSKFGSPKTFNRGGTAVG